MSAVTRPKHYDDARRLLTRIGCADHTDLTDVDDVAQALAEAEEYGVRKALHRLGPCIADAEVAREELAREVDL